MLKYFTSKIAIAVYVLIVLGAVFFAYKSYEKQTASPAAPSIENQTQSDAASNPQTVAQTEAADPALGGSSSATSTDNSTSSSSSSDSSTSSTSNIPDPSAAADSSSSDTNAPAVSAEKDVSGSTLAHITTDNCNNSCQAFASNLSQLEYCQEVCGISPVKDITSSSTCKDKSGIDKDYCYKDLAITKEDNSYCSDISDANIKQTCQSRIQQDAIESQGNSGSDN